MSVLDNKARQLQATGPHNVSHNALLKQGLETLDRSDSLNKETPSGYEARLVFDIGLFIALRPTALATLSVSQFQKMKLTVNGFGK